jgi:hypothetical protein
MVNFAAGIMIATIPVLAIPTNTPGIFYDYNHSQTFIEGSIGAVNPNPVATDAGDANVQLLDLIGLGKINKLITLIKTYLYGFPTLLDNIFGSYMEEGTRTIIFGFPFGLFYTIINIGYFLMGLYLWSGRRLNEDK